MYKGLDVSRVTDLRTDITPAYLDRLRATVKGKLIIKGIIGAEDAVIAVEHGADAVVVSNHGGRNEETLRATLIVCPKWLLPCAAARPYSSTAAFGAARTSSKRSRWAQQRSASADRRSGARGVRQPGVEAVSTSERELAKIMRQAGTPRIANITGARCCARRACVVRDGQLR